MKKLNKLFAILVAMAMVLSLTVISAFAKTSTPNSADPYENATITVSKIFKIPAGVTHPAETFKFIITKDSVDDVSTDAAKATMPALTLDNIVIPATAIASADNDIVKNGTIILPKLTGDVATGFPHAGVYKYILTEDTTDAATNTDVKYNTGSDSYDLYIYVANDGTVTPIVVKSGDTPTKDNPETTDVDENNKKDVDPPKPGDDDYDTDPEDEQLSDVNFTNVYDVIADKTPIPEDGDENTPDVASAVISKTVPTTGGADLTKQFKFTLTYSDANYQGDKSKLDVKYIKIAENGVRSDITAKTKEDGYFTLANGEKFAITGAPVGATYSVTEVLDDAAADKYTPKYKINTAAEVNGTQGTDLALADAVLIQKDSSTVAYTNTKTADTTPEGILISNLPYIALALVAIGGLVAYVVVRRRNADEA